VQLGYFGHFADSSWLWGAKFKYKYLGIAPTERGIVVPQAGSFTTVGVPPVSGPLFGNVLIESSQTNIDHELSLLAFVGHSFMNATVYIGDGPVVFATRSNLNRAIGFGSVNGMPTDITGAPVSFSSSKWMWGGAGQIGMTYYFARSWFLDFNYTYTVTREYTNDYSAPFLSSSAGLTYTGTAYITTRQRITSQAFAVSLNAAF
jgi:hypothetical protein